MSDMFTVDSKIIKVSIFLFLSLSIVGLIIFNFLNENKARIEYDPLKPDFVTPMPEKDIVELTEPEIDQVPEPTPTPYPPSFAGKFMAELVTNMKLNPSDISIFSYEEETFNDSGLGCPEPGKMYMQVMTPGWIIIFSADKKKYEFHSNLDGSNFINCTKIKSIDTENLVVKYNLASSNTIVVERAKEESFIELAYITDDDEKRIFLETINREIIIQDEFDCTYLYKIIFYIDDKSALELYSVCSDGSPVGIIASDKGNYYTLPEKFLDELGRLTSILPMPGKPNLE